MRWLFLCVATAMLGINLFPEQASGARILSLALVSSKSHKITYQRLLHELGNRGHELVVLSPIAAAKPHKNVKEILTFDAEALLEKSMSNMYELKETSSSVGMLSVIKNFALICNESYHLPQVQQIMNEKFDLILMSAIFNECAAGLVHRLNTSLILVSPATAPFWISTILGGPSPPSFVPNPFMGYGDKMNFFQRVVNLVVTAGLTAWIEVSYRPLMNSIYRDALGDQSLPSSDEVFMNASLMLTNSHYSLGTPRPFLPDIIEVGGMHCESAKPLPKDLEEFVKSSGEDGFILFSMGSALKGSMMPDKKRKILLGAFAKLKQKVLWKWETETMEDLPKNVKLSKWLPQQDVLGHPKCRLFITHGGFGSTTEAVYHGVPLVGIPMFGDQHLNMQRAEASGFAIPLDYLNLNDEDLIAAINKIISEPSYKNNVQALAKVFRDQPDKALDRAVYWTEYVLRHKGAVHLRSAARDLNFFQYHSIDVVAFIFAVVFLALYIVFAILRFIVRKICGPSKKTAPASKKRN